MPSFVRRIVIGALLAGFAAFGVLSAQAKPPVADGPASAMIEQFHNSFLKSWKTGAGRAFAARQAAFRPVVGDCYDIAFMARVAVGRYWDQMSEAERKSLVSTMTDATISNYASRFKSYKGQKFVILDERPGPQDRMLVRTQIIRTDADPVNITYLVEKNVGRFGWAIIDVWLNDTISELAMRRSEYVSVLKSQGTDGLLRQLKMQIARISDEPSGPQAPAAH